MRTTDGIGIWSGTIRQGHKQIKSGALDHLFKPTGVQQLNGTSLHLNQAFFLQARKKPADGLELEPEKARNFLSRHAQDEFPRGIPARLIALGKVQQEKRETLLGGSTAEKQHHVLISAKVSRHQPEKIASQRRNLQRELIQVLEGQKTYVTVLERNDLAGVPIAPDAVQAQNFPRNVISNDLFAAVLRQQ
jgi:hypothetical protein